MEITIKAEKPAPPSAPACLPLPPAEEGVPEPVGGAPVPAEPPAPLADLTPEEALTPLAAPLAGIFYRTAAPEDPPFVQEGDRIAEGQIVGTIEAMKIFNDIQSEFSGRVVRILAENEQLVMQGDPLMLLDCEDLEN